MKILLLHLSDIHITTKKDVDNANIDKIVQALNSLGTLDECVLIVSGDITESGKLNEFKMAGFLMGALVNKLKEKKFTGKWIHVLTVPGNHDIDFEDHERSFEDIIGSFKHGTIKNLINNDIKALEKFYRFARFNNCFKDNNLVSQISINPGNIYINFSLINTAIFSIKGGTNKDKGIHYLDKEDIYRIVPHSKGNLNIAVMHHSYEWFFNKEELLDTLSENFALVLEGHEHDGFGESRKINNKNTIYFIQGNSLSGDKKHEKGFITIVYDTSNNSIKGTSFLWNKDYYKGTEVLSEVLTEDKSLFVNTKDFINYLKYDDNGNVISNFFVFPSLSITTTHLNEDLETKIIDDEIGCVQTILSNVRTIISGDGRSGKSTLAKILYKYLFDSEEGFVPLLLVGGDLRHVRVERIVEYAFRNQYNDNNNSYDKFLQLEKNKRVLVIDDAGKIIKTVLNKILEEYEDMFDKIILFSEQEIDLNIKKRVIDQLTDKQVGHINIRPFLYDKRKLLISKAYDKSHFPEDEKKRQQIINEINNMIVSQIKFFRLNPEFITNFVIQYSEKFKLDFSPESNVFNIVYENSIKTRIINATNDISNVSGIFMALQEIAYYMRFERKPWITSVEISKIIEAYNDEYRQTVKLSHVLEVGERAKIFIEEGSQIRFKDNNLLAYFVAQALNRRIHHDEDNANMKFEELLNNLCFGINSDIVLFLTLITDNPKAITFILDCATRHFEHIEELSFDNNNIPFLCESNFKVKNSIPDEKEKNEKERQLVKYEEEVYSPEIVELIDEYNYDDQDVQSFENQLLMSIKYLEILSKILPAFGHNMKAIQQDFLVQALYKFPNKFIYQLLHEISENLQDYIQGIYKEASDIRKEKNIVELSTEDIAKKIEEMSISLVVALYQLIATTTSTKKTIDALDAFNYKDNSNYSIMNLMMNEKARDIKTFSNKAIKIYNESPLRLMKALVRFTVRNYFLDHDVKFMSEVQALVDNVFEDQTKQKIKNEIVRNKLKALQS